MTVYSEHYHYQHLTTADIRKIWKDFFEHYDRIAMLHLFSRVVATPGLYPSTQIARTRGLVGDSESD